MSTTFYLDEIEVPGKRLGRHINHDPRSWDYRIGREAAPASVSWTRRIPILDQGSLGSCTGNALVGALGTDPDFDTLVATIKTTLTESLAIQIYSEAEKIDGGAGYPPEDEGSSGLSVAKAAVHDGLLSGYQHAMSVEEAHAAIQTGPFIVGSYWYTSMDSPVNGLVTVGGSIRGGHEYECLEYDLVNDLWIFANSWGSSWGKSGYFCYNSATFANLLSQDGDVTQLVPISAPAPVPTPGHDPADAALAAAADQWEPWIKSSKTRAGRLRAALDTWKAAKGF